ncbi:MAG TPA: cyclic nucleotide-binding domain-containing protein [Thermodesulfobacteriota bacterium]|nr:cyclic nucleotide-binding domain-containing protein [Thermodesulfobacteriota bacterium]
MEEEKFLKGVSILRDLEEEELRQFLKIARQVRFSRGDAILTEGQTGETMYIIEEGSVEITKTLVLSRNQEDSRNQDKVLTRLSAEDHAIFGEVALFEQSKRTATVVALTDCLLLEIARADFLRLAEENPRIGYKITRNITRLLCSRLRKADEDTVKLTTALSIALSR